MAGVRFAASDTDLGSEVSRDKSLIAAFNDSTTQSSSQLGGRRDASAGCCLIRWKIASGFDRRSRAATCAPRQCAQTTTYWYRAVARVTSSNMVGTATDRKQRNSPSA